MDNIHLNDLGEQRTEQTFLLEDEDNEAGFLGFTMEKWRRIYWSQLKEIHWLDFEDIKFEW